MTGFSPTLYNRKQPVPYVFFAEPGVNPCWPTNADDWSPRHPAIFTPFKRPDLRYPNASGDDDGTILGRFNFLRSNWKKLRSCSAVAQSQQPSHMRIEEGAVTLSSY